MRLGEPFYPGWKLFCSDCSAHGPGELGTFPLQEYFIAAALPPGTHRLYLVYRPKPWAAGAAISSAAAAALAGLLIAAARRRAGEA